MKIYLSEHGSLLLRVVDIDDDNFDFDTRLAGETVDISRKIEIVQDLRDACESFLEEQSQEIMKERW